MDVFDVNGVLLRRLVTDGALNIPWGLAQASHGITDNPVRAVHARRRVYTTENTPD